MAEHLPSTAEVIWTWFLHAQKQHRGEDAEPLALELGPEHGLVAVFDGMGGAGAEQFETANGKYTGAYLAARLASRVVRDLIAELSPVPPRVPGVSRPAEADSSALSKPVDRQKAAVHGRDLERALQAQLMITLQDRFAVEAERLGGPRSRLRSNLLKVLPTTMVAAHFYPQPPEQEGVCIVHWAGDSRGFLLHPEQGLVQVTQDDLRSGGDALANLTQDSPVTNFVNASTAFEVRRHRITTTYPYAIVLATDGCFGYVPTPAHFEHLLLETLVTADSAEDWSSRLKAAVCAVAGDDASMVAVALGWQAFEELKRSFVPRLQHLRERYIEPLLDAERRLQEAEHSLRAQQAFVGHLRTELWDSYREDYEQLLPQRRNGEA